MLRLVSPIYAFKAAPQVRAHGREGSSIASGRSSHDGDGMSPQQGATTPGGREQVLHSRCAMKASTRCDLKDANVLQRRLRSCSMLRAWLVGPDEVWIVGSGCGGGTDGSSGAHDAELQGGITRLREMARPAIVLPARHDPQTTVGPELPLGPESMRRHDRGHGDAARAAAGGPRDLHLDRSLRAASRSGRPCAGRGAHHCTQRIQGQNE
jgi:hypothetical protein